MPTVLLHQVVQHGAQQALAAQDAVGDLPRFSAGAVFAQWGLDPYLFVGTVWVAGLYMLGVRTLHARGDRWPLGRSVAFLVGGVGSFYFATQSGLAAYDDTLLSAHMVQHMILSMVVPLFLALGAPVTLALRTLPKRPRSWLLAVLHSRGAKVLTFPPLTLALYVASPWALYFTGWYTATLHSDYQHEMMHVHLVLVGCLFFWPLLGIDPLPGRMAYPFRLLMIFLSLPFHAFLGVTIMGQSELIGGDWYPALHRTMTWLPDPAADQRVAGGILWASGDLIGLMFFTVLFVQWVRASMQEARREDRRLDRLERAQAASAGEVGPGGRAASTGDVGPGGRAASGSDVSPGGRAASASDVGPGGRAASASERSVETTPRQTS